MTTKDKTGDQLMASIRKTKTEGAASERDAAPKAAPVTPRAAAAPKAAPAIPKAPAAPRKKAAAGAKPAAAQRTRVTKKKVAAKPRATQIAAPAKGDSYQSTGRVWPD